MFWRSSLLVLFFSSIIMCADADADAVGHNRIVNVCCSLFTLSSKTRSWYLTIYYDSELNSFFFHFFQEFNAIVSMQHRRKRLLLLLIVWVCVVPFIGAWISGNYSFARLFIACLRLGRLFRLDRSFEVSLSVSVSLLRSLRLFVYLQF